MAFEGCQPLVVDNGTGVVKAGFAGADRPRLVLDNVVGRPKHAKVMAGGAAAAAASVFVGDDCRRLRGVLRLRPPMRHGVVHDWDDMCTVWAHMYHALQAVPDEHPVLLTEAPLNPVSNRARSMQVFFEQFRAPALYIGSQAILSLYASGRTTGVVLDSGDGVTHAVPVFEGFSVPHAITRMDLAGQDLTEHLQVELRKAGCRLTTSAEMAIVRAIKEATCFVARRPDEVDREHTDWYTLPDGNVVDVGTAAFRVPELLFQPEQYGYECPGVPQSLTDAIEKSDMDLRIGLYENIVLAGGTTLLRGFPQRLLDEVQRRAPRNVRVRIYAPADRMYSCWIGGSIFSSLATFERMWISRAQFEESGESALFRSRSS
ncbi:actin [Plasmodiophora brassicae]|uniref:Uncharacterized protein n=1 Tax=Plasmodiophora brassicae TaxID=37360 RepID=A0A0G4IZZ9_PLABS|nr:hypothetical protein PBRA_008270 [Plasmodiophora brassicae]